MDSKIKRGGTVDRLYHFIYNTIELFYRYVDNDCGRAF